MVVGIVRNMLYRYVMGVLILNVFSECRLNELKPPRAFKRSWIRRPPPGSLCTLRCSLKAEAMLILPLLLSILSLGSRCASSCPSTSIDFDKTGKHPSLNAEQLGFLKGSRSPICFFLARQNGFNALPQNGFDAQQFPRRPDAS